MMVYSRFNVSKDGENEDNEDDEEYEDTKASNDCDCDDKSIMHMDPVARQINDNVMVIDAEDNASAMSTSTSSSQYSMDGIPVTVKVSKNILFYHTTNF